MAAATGIAARFLAVGDVVAGRRVERVERTDGRVLVSPHGAWFDRGERVLVDGEVERWVSAKRSGSGYVALVVTRSPVGRVTADATPGRIYGSAVEALVAGEAAVWGPVE